MNGKRIKNSQRRKPLRKDLKGKHQPPRGSAKNRGASVTMPNYQHALLAQSLTSEDDREHEHLKPIEHARIEKQQRRLMPKNLRIIP